MGTCGLSVRESKLEVLEIPSSSPPTERFYFLLVINLTRKIKKEELCRTALVDESGDEDSLEESIVHFVVNLKWESKLESFVPIFPSG